MSLEFERMMNERHQMITSYLMGSLKTNFERPRDNLIHFAAYRVRLHLHHRHSLQERTI